MIRCTALFLFAGPNRHTQLKVEVLCGADISPTQIEQARKEDREIVVVMGVGFDEDSVQSVGKLLPHLIILDVRSGGRDVAALCNELQQNPDTRRIQVLLLQGAFDGQSRSELPGLSSSDRLLKPFVFDRLREKVEALIKAAPEPVESVPAAGLDKVAVPDAIAISDDELDEALKDALKELRAESVELEIEDMGFALSAADAVPDTADGTGLDEGVRREEVAELLEKGPLGEAKAIIDEDKHLEAKTMVDETRDGGTDAMDDQKFLDKMIDNLVDTAMERVSIELKASLKNSLNEKMRQMARRAIQELMPRLSERLIAEMFRSESEKQ